MPRVVGFPAQRAFKLRLCLVEPSLGKEGTAKIELGFGAAGIALDELTENGLGSIGTEAKELALRLEEKCLMGGQKIEASRVGKFGRFFHSHLGDISPTPLRG
jgi:hypothetical protein